MLLCAVGDYKSNSVRVDPNDNPNTGAFVVVIKSQFVLTGLDHRGDI